MSGFISTLSNFVASATKLRTKKSQNQQQQQNQQQWESQVVSGMGTYNVIFTVGKHGIMIQAISL